MYNIIELENGTLVKRRLGPRQEAVLVRYTNGYKFDTNVKKYPKKIKRHTVSFWIDTVIGNKNGNNNTNDI